MTGPALTYALRELVWGLESEVAVVTSLSRRIDEHVTALNAARAELAERLERLDAAVAAARGPGTAGGAAAADVGAAAAAGRGVPLAAVRELRPAHPP